MAKYVSIKCYAYYDSLVNQFLAGDINNQYMLKEQGSAININAIEHKYILQSTISES